MSKVTLKNMPNGVLYEFAPGQYVWRIVRPGGTREGNYLEKMDSYREFTEVFSLGNDGNISCSWSGSLGGNAPLYNEEGLDDQRCFYIFSPDADCGARYKQEHDLIKADANLQLQALRDEKRVIDFIKGRIEERYRK